MTSVTILITGESYAEKTDARNTTIETRGIASTIIAIVFLLIVVTLLFIIYAAFYQRQSLDLFIYISRIIVLDHIYDPASLK